MQVKCNYSNDYVYIYIHTCLYVYVYVYTDYIYIHLICLYVYNYDIHIRAPFHPALVHWGHRPLSWHTAFCGTPASRQHDSDWMSGMSGATVNIQVDIDVWCFMGKSSKKECLMSVYESWAWIDMNCLDRWFSMIFRFSPEVFTAATDVETCLISSAQMAFPAIRRNLKARRATTLKTLHVYNGMLQIALKKAISVPFLWKNSCFETFFPWDGSSKSWDLLFVDPWSFL